MAMICVSIAQQSHRFALVDMLNAGPQCDLIELRLDRFTKAPEVGLLLEAKPKPVICSCRRARDGGEWTGSEDERLALLRQCIVAKSDYVEIELDVAGQIREYPPSQRVISYTNLGETPPDITDIYAEAQTHAPDVIKLTTTSRTPEEAWPLVQLLVKPPVPTIVVGLGRPGLMLTLLGKKIGAPWAYAALERGMEAYPGQPTVADLNDVYHYPVFKRSTRLIGVTGLGEHERANVGLLNAALADLDLPARCLPMQVGSVPLFRRVIDAVHMAGVIVDDEHRAGMLGIATRLDAEAERARAADVMLHLKDGWHAHCVEGHAAVRALEATMRAGAPVERPLENRPVMILGCNARARMLSLAIASRGGAPIIASRDRAAAQELAKEVGGRHTPFEGIYTTMHDVLAVCAEERQPTHTAGRRDESTIHAGHLRAGLVVMDLTSPPRQQSTLLRLARERGCRVVSPRAILIELAAQQSRLLAGKSVPPEVLTAAADRLLGEE
jgi:3-dehydroquinate dehydratase/shikimate dehydrogenase